MSAQLNIKNLIDALYDERRGVRQFAARRLALLGEEAVEPLLNQLTSVNDEVAETAIATLSGMGEIALPYVLQAMQSENRRLSWGAALVLSAMRQDVRESVAQ